MDSHSCKNRFAAITVVYAALALLHTLCLILNVEGFISPFTKGLPIIFLCVCTCIWAREHPRVILALMFSFLGDYAAELSLPGHLAFHLQIIFFAAAQVCYITEFLRYCGNKASGRRDGEGRGSLGDKALSLTPILCACYGVLVLTTAITSFFQHREHKKMIVAGAVTFAVSDSLILVRMLTGGFPLDDTAVIVTYYLAQYLINIPLLAKR